MGPPASGHPEVGVADGPRGKVRRGYPNQFAKPVATAPPTEGDSYAGYLSCYCTFLQDFENLAP